MTGLARTVLLSRGDAGEPNPDRSTIQSPLSTAESVSVDDLPNSAGEGVGFGLTAPAAIGAPADGTGKGDAKQGSSAHHSRRR